MNRLVSPPIRLVAIIFCSTGSSIRDSLRCNSSMKLGIHSAPDRVSTGSTVGASSSTRPRAGSSTISSTNCSTASAGVFADARVAMARAQTSS
ncbi:Uncharacterised protein [Mycobacterium tuberculosis]|nr:Uncharacterised protein [Mycobacterium tuberculosis]